MKQENIRERVQREATQSVVTNRFSGVLEISPRTGKSKITIDALNTISKDIDVLIIAPRKEIFDSWKVEFKKWGLRSNINVDFIWSNSLKKNTKKYHLIVADEIHSYNLNVMRLLMKEQNKGSRILALTGTLDGNTQYLIESSLKLNVLYSYSVDDAIKDGIVADYEIFCVGVDLDNEDKYILAGNEDKQFYQTELEAYTYWNNRYNKAKAKQKWSELQFLMSKRTNLIYNSVTKLLKTREIVEKLDRCLIFTGRQEIADSLGEASYHSKSDKTTLDSFKNGTINKLSTIGKISMGVTILDLKVAVFNQLKSNENTAIQMAMRTMNMEGGRKATIYIVYLRNTQDFIWLQSALQGFDNKKIKYL
jgi:superfamily II DNA or RNA helicase